LFGQRSMNNNTTMEFRRRGACAAHWAGLAWPLWAPAAALLVALSGCGRSSSPEDSPAPASPPPAAAPTVETAQVAGDDRAVDTVTPGQQLFARHCAACHGAQGDGKGIAAAFLFPKPRDFRAGRFRLVSTTNNVPLREDLHAVMLRGMPGSAMPPFAHLSQDDREALVDEILRLRQDGARQSYMHRLIEDEGLTDEEIAAEDVQEEINNHVAEVIVPGQSTDVPPIPVPTEDSIVRGQDVYKHFACVQCHGETGRGDGVQAMFDDEKMPTRPRDFTLGIFKGNHDEASLYRRIAYGMPGTPMPSSSGMTPEQMIDLVHYIRSMSSEEDRQDSILKRNTIVVRRVERLPGLNGSEWNAVPAVTLRTTPLWWGTKTRSNVDLTVQALHDGNSLSIRLAWPDETDDEHAVTSASFEDGAAMQLYRGEAEPFLGMGDNTAAVDVWFWDADRQAGPQTADAAYPNAVVDIYPFSEAAVETAELNRPGAVTAGQPAVSMPARAAGNQIVPTSDESGGSELHVGGPGSVTFRPEQSQIVPAHGKWRDGHWTVVMSRALAPNRPDAGVALAPGVRASAAFAIWDGAQKDRDGQKSITIWQDLELER
jgi:DMSO reductase family type II enzyme heme b subunit